MATFAPTLERVKQDLNRYLPVSAIEQACREAGHRWRRRKFDPVTTLQLFVLQVLCFNTAITHLRHLARRPVNAAAYCKARMRLPVAALHTLLERSALAIAGVQGRRLWCGLRTFLVDATSTIAPDTSDTQKQFPQPKGQKEGCGFPVPKILGLFDALSGLIMQALLTPLYRHELPGMVGLHPALRQGDLLVGDRAFCAYAHFGLLAARQVLGLFRLHASRIVRFERGGRRKRQPQERGRPHAEFVRRLGQDDQLVRWRKPRECYRPKWMSLEQFRKLPEELRIRELRFRIPAGGGRTRVVIIATTLLDPALYPKEKIAKLYGLRWTIETHFAELKTTLKMRRIKCQTAAGVEKEILVHLLVYNLIHAVMLQAAGRQKVAPDRISFIDTLRWMLAAAPGDALPDLLMNPRRKGRHQPRVVKDRHDGYQRMTQSRATMNRHPADFPGRK
jgi:hypothetical protein